MAYSFAALVREQLPCVRQHLSAGEPESAAAQPPTFTMADYEALAEALAEDRLLAWLEEMRARGGQVAGRHGSVEALFREALAFISRLRACIVEDMPGGVPDDPRLAADLDGLATSLLTTLLAGYVDARELEIAEQKAQLDIANALHEVNSAANSTLNLDAVLEQTAQAVVKVSAADVCSLFIYEPEIDRLVMRATWGLNRAAVGKVFLRRTDGVTGAAAELGKPIAVRAARDDSRFFTLPMLGEEDCRSILSVPIVLYTTEHKLVGVITVESRTERDFGPREIKFLETVAGEIAIAIENARLYQQTDSRLRQKVAELEMLQGFSATIAEKLDLREVLRLLAADAAYLVGADAAVVYELHNIRLEPVAVYSALAAAPTPPPAGEGGTDAEQQAFAALPALALRDQLLHRTILAGQPVGLHMIQTNGHRHWVSEDDEAGQQALDSAGLPDDLPYQTIFCVPLSAPRGIVGAICLYSRAPRTYDPEQIALLNAFAREGAIAVENARLYEAALHGLEVKTWLMREMNHRVRNNLARAVSLLQMQQRRLGEDTAAAKALTDSIVRMESIARVHDLLSREELGITGLPDLVRLATDVVINTLSRPDLRIHWQIAADPIPITSPTAFPLLLALVELLSNALLHGFAGRDEGTIGITATAPTGQVEIRIVDDGEGLPPDFDPEQRADLGLMIVQLLVQSELKGSFAIAPAPPGGTQATIRFTNSAAEQ